MELDALGGLIKLGLREKEARAYLTLLRLGEASATQISKTSGIHPRSTYDALEALVSRGLATFAEKDGVRLYAGCGLDALRGLVDEKRALVDQLVPALEGQLKSHRAPLVRVFRGKEGMKVVWEDLLKEGKTIYFYGGMMQGFRLYMRNYCLQWNRRREKLGIPFKFLFIDVPGVREVLSSMGNYSAKPLPTTFVSSVPWWLYGDKQVIVFWGEEPLAILIESPELAKTYLHFFNAMWKNVKGAVGPK